MSYKLIFLIPIFLIWFFPVKILYAAATRSATIALPAKKSFFPHHHISLSVAPSPVSSMSTLSQVHPLPPAHQQEASIHQETKDEKKEAAFTSRPSEEGPSLSGSGEECICFNRMKTYVYNENSYVVVGVQEEDARYILKIFNAITRNLLRTLYTPGKTITHVGIFRNYILVVYAFTDTHTSQCSSLTRLDMVLPSFIKNIEYRSLISSLITTPDYIVIIFDNKTCHFYDANLSEISQEDIKLFISRCLEDYAGARLLKVNVLLGGSSVCVCIGRTVCAYFQTSTGRLIRKEFYHGTAAVLTDSNELIVGQNNGDILFNETSMVVSDAVEEIGTASRSAITSLYIYKNLLLVSATENGEIKIWDLSEKKCIQTFYIGGRPLEVVISDTGVIVIYLDTNMLEVYMLDESIKIHYFPPKKIVPKKKPCCVLL